MTYIPRRDITDLIPNKFEAIRVLALECRRLNEEIRAREDVEVEGKLTSLAVQQMLDGKVTYFDAKERREQERSEAMLSAAEGLLDMVEPMMEPELEVSEDEAPVAEAATEAATEAAEGVPAEASAEDGEASEEASPPVDESPDEVEAAPEAVTNDEGMPPEVVDTEEETVKEAPEA